MTETKPLCASSSNLADMFAIVRGWTLLILEVNSQDTIDMYGNKHLNMMETKLLCASSSNLVDRLTMVREKKLADFGGYMSKLCGWDIVTLLWFCVTTRLCVDLVNMIETKPMCASSANLADVHYDERMNPIDFGGQRSRSQLTYMEISL